MKVGYFINQYPSVSHSFIRREILALERQGLEVRRYALRGWQAVLVDPEDLGERGRTRFVLQGGLLKLAFRAVGFGLRHPLSLLAGLRKTMSLAWQGDRTPLHHLVGLCEAIVLVEWMRADGVSHVHAHFGTNSAAVVSIARALGGPPFSFTVHGADELDAPRPLKLRDKIRDARFAIGISSFICAHMVRWAERSDRAKLHVVHCGLDRHFLAVEATPVPDTARIVCVGRLCNEKCQDLLVEAVARLRERGVEVQLALVGDGDLRAAIETRIAHHGLGDCVTITGWASGERVREELLASRLLVLPSVVEGLPVVIMEAMALGRPIVSTYVGGIPELVRPGREGWLSPAGDLERLVETLEEALRTPIETLRGMGLEAQRRVRERHDVDVEAAKLARLFADPA
jgi:colanic acid/amylovoran biosynthesis glycosyltransferase